MQNVNPQSNDYLKTISIVKGLPQPNHPVLWRSELHTAAILQIPVEHSAILTSSSNPIANSKINRSSEKKKTVLLWRQILPAAKLRC